MPRLIVQSDDVILLPVGKGDELKGMGAFDLAQVFEKLDFFPFVVFVRKKQRVFAGVGLGSVRLICVQK